MRIEAIPVQLRSLPSDHPRSVGIHQSTVLRKMAAERGILKDIDPAELSLVEATGPGFWNSLDPVSQLRMSMGLAWEEWYAKQLEDVTFHPGEHCLDGIYMTPDGESMDFIYHDDRRIYVPAIHEIKVTYKSVNTVQGLQGDKNWLWRAQVMGYCKALNTNIAYVHVLFPCGDYSFPIAPQLRCWRVEFSWMEINQHWGSVVAYVRYMTSLEREEEMKD